MNRVTASYTCVLNAFIASLIPFCLLWQSSNMIIPVLLLSGLLLLNFISRKTAAINAVDLLVILILIYEGAILFCTPARQNGLPAFMIAYIATAYYFLLRLSVTTKKAVKTYFLWSAIGTALFIAGGLVSFFDFKKNAWLAGFNPETVKHLFRPLGYLNNVWSTILLGTLTVVIWYAWYQRHSKRALWFAGTLCCSITFLIFASFSRGTYVAFGVLALITIVIWLRSARSWKQKIAGVAGGLITLSILALPNIYGVIQTGRMNTTVSQQRSWAGRVNAFSQLGPLCKEGGPWGVGNHNYSLAVDELQENDDNSFTDFAPNIFLQLIVEKGWFGSALWMAFTGFLLYAVTYKARNRMEAIICVSLLTMLIIREMAFPVFFLAPGLQLIVLGWIAIFVNRNLASLTIRNTRMRHLSTILAVSLAVIVVQYRVLCHNIRHNEHFLEALEQNHLVKASQAVNRADNRTAFLIHRGCLAWKQYEQSGDRQWLLRARRDIINAQHLNPRDIMLRHHLAVIDAYTGDREKPRKNLEELVDRFPNNALFRFSLGKLSYDQEDIANAVMHWTRMIMIMPAILETPEWRRLMAADTTVRHLIAKNLETVITQQTDDPIQQAKYGKLALEINQSDLARKHLTAAIAQLPNLIRPWESLAHIEAETGNPDRASLYRAKSMFLATGQYQENPEQRLEHTQISTMKGLLFSKYILKFTLWYGFRSTPDATAIISID